MNKSFRHVHPPNRYHHTTIAPHSAKWEILHLVHRDFDSGNNHAGTQENMMWGGEFEMEPPRHEIGHTHTHQ